jgi:gluconate kinase
VSSVLNHYICSSLLEQYRDLVYFSSPLLPAFFLFLTHSSRVVIIHTHMQERTRMCNHAFCHLP